MNLSHPEISIQAAPSTLQKVWNGFKRILSQDPGLILQLLLTLPVIFGGIILHLNGIQWILVGFVTLIYLGACVMRTASLLQINHDKSLTAFHVSRIKCMGNAILTVTAGLSLITYMVVFVPLIMGLI